MCKDKLAQVFHFDLYGKREHKYDFLNENTIASIAWNNLDPTAPNHFFVNKDLDEQKNYEKGFAVNELFSLNSVGIVTARDAILISENINELHKNVQSYFNIEMDKTKIRKIAYRPFDKRNIYYDTKLVERARENVMQHFLNGDNVGLVTARQCVGNWQYIFCTKFISEFNLTGTAGRFGSGSSFPLYLYPSTTGQQTIDQTSPPLEGLGEVRTPNLNTEIINEIAKKLGLTFTNEKETIKNTFAPIDVLDYIYAVLHSPTYREKYKEFLKINFPRVPYPKSEKTFWSLVNLGTALRQIHLLESPIVEQYITQYPVDGNNTVTKPKYISGKGFGKVFINETQYFDHVPEVAWTFFIGGYQPAQKWLKDRKERTLEFEDILHYQKIIVALTQTNNIMAKIDSIEIE